jgi:tRNA U34 5-carboxymethylaminomethyl modifying GTPase MnmE/TrmE
MNIFVPLFTMHPSQSQETIAALATPPGQGAIAVIRLSGKEAFHILETVKPYPSFRAN